MCNGSKRKPSQTGLISEHEYGREEELHRKISALLEFSAKDDVIAFKDAVEKYGCDVDEVGLWYGRKVGSKEMSYEERTPLMIAALFGSKGVLCYILETGLVDVNRACGSDGATALHCAVFGCSAASVEVVKLLVDASADVSSLDANGNRSSDLIDSVSNSVFGSRKKILAILEGKDGVDYDAGCLMEGGFQMVNLQQDSGSPRIEKKDYRVDTSLPDIKSVIYSTDEFRMYTFKVKPCSRAYSHDWTECPFAHPGENAKRRDPRKYHYSCVPCPEFRNGSSCIKGDACEYAHGIFETWLHPAQYRTRLCKDDTKCTRRVCFFAHNSEELRPVYAFTGSALPSPTSYSNSPSASSMDSFTVNSPSEAMPPLTPSAVSSPSCGGTMWPNQSHVATPTLHMPRIRMNTAHNARDNIELVELENLLIQRKLMIEEMTNWFSGVNLTNLEDIFGSSRQSPSSMLVHQNVNQHLRVYPSDITNSNVIGSPQFRADRSMSSRYDAFTKWSHSFIERSSTTSFNSELPSAMSVAAAPSNFSGWGSPDGKLDWSIRGDELNKMRKSYSFGFRNTNSFSAMAAPNVDNPDVLSSQERWINSLVKNASFSNIGI
ncbi:hypothetical protein P8452_16929 [Trifolium repens]|nr:hypothetical protein P8452_16929 [Trifolium repens]